MWLSGLKTVVPHIGGDAELHLHLPYPLHFILLSGLCLAQPGRFVPGHSVSRALSFLV